jgi:DNA invertase Pin-like site-specific DNA recombinase
VGERVSAGLTAAREQGRKGGRPPALDDATRAALLARRAKGESVTDAAKALKISRATAYRALSPTK